MGGFRKLIGGEEVTGSREMIMGSTMGGDRKCWETAGKCQEMKRSRQVR